MIFLTKARHFPVSFLRSSSKEAEDVDRLIKQGPWPDWKNRDQSSSYQSASVLGWMWRQMTQRMTLIQSQKLLHPEDPDDKILYILSKCCDDHLLDAMKNQMATAVKNYLSGRRFHKENTKEEYYCWQRKYCKRERIKLIEERSSNSAADQSSLAAAVLYCQCFGFEHIDRHSKACEFAWLVAEGELLQIFSGEGSLPVSCERLPDMVRR